jgi:hypothetical protein
MIEITDSISLTMLCNLDLKNSNYYNVSKLLTKYLIQNKYDKICEGFLSKINNDFSALDNIKINNHLSLFKNHDENIDKYFISNFSKKYFNFLVYSRYTYNDFNSIKFLIKYLGKSVDDIILATNIINPKWHKESYSKKTTIHPLYHLLDMYLLDTLGKFFYYIDFINNSGIVINKKLIKKIPPSIHKKFTINCIKDYNNKKNKYSECLNKYFEYIKENNKNIPDSKIYDYLNLHKNQIINLYQKFKDISYKDHQDYCSNNPDYATLFGGYKQDELPILVLKELSKCGYLSLQLAMPNETDNDNYDLVIPNINPIVNKIEIEI